MKKKLSVFTAVLLIAVMLATPAAAATLTTVETQFTYSESNPAWLKDLVVREDMTNPSSIAQALTLTAKPDYPYSKTPEAFRTEVNYYVQLYSLDQNSQKAAYIYVLQYVNQFASEATKNVSDEFIREYLINEGIAYPDGGLGDYENLIFARALYTLLSTNAIKVTIPKGTTVQDALVRCMTEILGIDPTTFALWSASAVASFDDYVLVACKIALNTNGYRVDKYTAPDEVYRMIAVMMIRQLGMSIDADTATFDEIKIKYLAALLGKQYNISLSPDNLSNALNNNETAFYILQVMGREANITVRPTMSFSDAFSAVAANTNHFDLEAGEFYADIYNYEVHLSYKRDRIWICPTAYRTSTGNESVLVYTNNNLTGSGQYGEITLDPSLSVQHIPVTVKYQSPSQTVSKTYTVTVYQGAVQAPASSSSSGLVSGGNSLISIASGNVTNVLANTFYSVGSALPERVNDIVGLMVPTLNNAANTVNSGINNSDYLSQLMYSASGGIIGSNTQLSTTPLQNQSGSLYGLGGLSGGSGAAGLSISFASPTAGNSLYGAPMLLSEAGAPPEGYEYLTDSQGYITAITPIKANSQTINKSGSTVTFDMIKNKLPMILIPALIAIITLAVLLLLKIKDDKKNKAVRLSQK